MNKYTIYCTSEQTKTALKLGAPIFTFSKSFADDYRNTIYDKYCSIPPIKEEGYEDEIYADIPTAEQMIGWLREQGENIFIREYSDTHEIYWQVNHRHGLNTGYSTSHKEATFAVIDAALNYLNKNEKNG